MRIRSFLLSVVSVAVLAGAAAHAQTTAEPAEQQSEGTIQGQGNFFRYRIDGLDPSLYDTPVVKVVQPRKFFIGEKPELTVMVQGGNRPYAFSLIGPALPKGLSFDPRKGNFVGSTKVPGTASYVMAVQDARGRVAQSEPFTVTFLDDFDESQFHAYPVEAFVDGSKLVSPQPIFDGSATTDVAASGFGSTVAVRFDQPIRAKTAIVAFSTEAAFGACSYDLEAKDPEGRWTQVHRASSLASGGVVQAFNLMPTPRSGFVSDEWRVNLTSGCRMRLSELRIASAPPNPPPAWQTPEGLLVAVGPVPLGVSIVAPEQSPYSSVPTRFELAGGSTLPAGFGLRQNGDLTGPDGEGFPYGRIDFRVRSTDGIGYWTERNYFITPDAVPARTAYPKSVSVGPGANVRYEMSDGKTGAGEASETVPPGGIMLFDYGRFVRVTGGTVLAGENVGSMFLEAEAGPDQWVDPVLVGGIAKRWRLVNQSGEAALLTEARLDGADFNHPPVWKTVEGPWTVGAEGMSFAGVRNPANGAVVEAAVQISGHRLPVEAETRNIFDQGPVAVAVAPGAALPDSVGFSGGAFALPKGEDFSSGLLTAKLRAVDPMGFWSERTFRFKPETVRAASREPRVAGPGGDVSMLLNDGLTDVDLDLKAGDELVWSFGRYVEVKDQPAVTASKANALVLEAETGTGWVQPSQVAGVAKRFRVRATADVKVSEYRLDGAPAILRPTWSPAGDLRTVDESGVSGTGRPRLAVTATGRNPYSDVPATVEAPGPLARGFSFVDGSIRVPYGPDFPAGLVRVELRAVDGLGVASTQIYPFQPASVRAASLVPKVSGGGVADPYFILNDGETGADARAASLQAGDTVVWDYGRFVRIEQPNVVDATDPALLALEAEIEDGWVPVAAVNTVSRRYRIRATAAVDVREYRIDGALAPQAPLWNTSAGPYVVDDRSIAGLPGFTLAFDASTRNPLTSAPPVYTLRNALPDGFAVRGQTISVVNGSAFPAGRVGVTIRAEDATGFYADRTFAFNPNWVRARPIKPDVRDPAGKDVFGLMSDGRPTPGVPLKAGEVVTLGYGQWVNASNGAAVVATGTVVVEAQTATGWVAASAADWIGQNYRVRAVTDAVLGEVRLDGLPVQPGPHWTTDVSDVRTIGSPTTIGLAAQPQSEFSDQTTVVYSGAGSLPPGFAVDGNRLTTPAAEELPSGLFAVVVRATDSVGIYSDLPIRLQPSASRAISVKPRVTGPAGDADLFMQMSDGVSDPDAKGVPAPGADLAVGESLVFDYGRYVFLFDGTVFAATGTYVFEAETSDGWVPAGSVNSRAKRFRFRATAAGTIREARLDGLEAQRAPVWTTAGTLRTIDQTGLSLALSATLRSRFGAPLAYSAAAAPLPQGFSLAGSTLTVPPGESFPSGAVSFALRAGDAVGYATDQTFAFAPATVRAKTVVPSNVADAGGATVTQVLNDDVKGAGAPGVALTAGQTVVWTFPRYVRIVAAENVVDATAPAALVLETDGGSAGWVPAGSLDTGKRFRIRATASVTVREYRLDGVGAFVLPTWTTAAQPWEVSPAAISGQTGLQLQLVANNNSPFPGAMAYALAPGASLPSGFSLSATGLLTVPSADVFPAGRVDVAVRATDPAGNLVDRTFAFHPLGLSAAGVAPKTVVAEGADLRAAMLDGRTASADASVVLSAGQSLVYDYGQQWVRIAANSVLDGVAAGAVLETVAADGSWVQMTASPASFPAAVQDQGGRTFRIRQVTGTSTIREARLGGLPALGPAWTTPVVPYAVNQTTIVGNSPAGFELKLASTKTSLTGSAVSYDWAPGFTVPAGFSLTADGRLTVPPGESFAARRHELPIRATTDDYTADRTFVFHPVGTAAAGVVPKSVVAEGADARVAMLDGRTAPADSSVTLTADQSLVYTYDRWVSIAAAATFDAVPANVTLEVQSGDGSWATLSNAPASGFPAAAIEQVGRVFRIRQVTGASTFREARLGGLPALGPTWSTANASAYVANQTAIVGVSPAGLALPLAATRTALTGTAVSYAFAPGFAPPAGFSVSAGGQLVVPPGEGFPYGRVAPVVRAATDDYTADRTFAFNPASVRLNSIAPTSVLDGNGASVVVPLYDGATGTSAPGVVLAAGESIVWTYPRFVQNVAAPNTDGVNLASLVFEVERGEGEWVAAATVDSIGRRFRIRSTAAGTIVREYRLDGAGTFLSPTWTTSTSVLTVNETTIVGATPAGLALQLQATNRSPYTTDPLRFELAPGASALPEGFALTSGGQITVPKGSSFPVGMVVVPVRAWDSTGFFADRTFTFVPEVAAMSSIFPSSVTGPDGADVFVPLYSGLNDTPVALPAGQSIVWTFPRYVTPNYAAIYVVTGNVGALVLETPAQDGRWTNVHYANAPGATTAAAAYGRTYRLRNTSAAAVQVHAARLGGIGAQAPLWVTSNSHPIQVSQTAVNGQTLVQGPSGQLAFALSATKVFSGATGLAYAAAPGAELPAGFEILADGTMRVPLGENFTGGLATIPVRVTDTRGFYANRSFQFHPASVPAKSLAPSSVSDPAGADVFTVLYDGLYDRTVALAPGESVGVVFPQYVNVTSYAAVGWRSTGGAGNLTLEAELADGSWSHVSTHNFYVAGSNASGVVYGLQNSSMAEAPRNVGRRFRFVNRTSATVTLTELRIDAGPAYTPTFVTGAGPWEVNQTEVRGVSPSALSFQIATKKAYAPSGDVLTYALSPTSGALPANFGLSSSGLVVVPQGESFTHGSVPFQVRATDSRGFYADQNLEFYPASVRANTIVPASVTAPDGSSAYAVLYDGRSDVSLTLAAGESVLVTYPQYVNIGQTAARNIVAGTYSLMLEKQLVDGNWQYVESVTNGTPNGPVAAPTSRISKTFRLRNSGTGPVEIREYRLDAAPVLAPVWATGTGPFAVGDESIAGQPGLSMPLAAEKKSPAPGALTYSLVPGQTVPDGFELDPAGVITVPSADLMPSGRVDLAVRVTDALGLFADQTLVFVPGAAVRANTLPPVSVLGPNGEDLRVALYDDRSDTVVDLEQGEAAVFTWDRWVQIGQPVQTTYEPYLGGRTIFAIETLHQDGTWRQIGTRVVNTNGVVSDGTAGVGADRYGRTFRIVNTSGRRLTFAELRPDAGPGYGVTIATSQAQRLVDDAGIAGVSPAGFDLRLAATSAHPASTGMSWTLRGVTPIAFTLTADGRINVPKGSDFPFGRVTVPVQVVDDRGFTRDADYPFVPASVPARTIVPQSVVGPNGEDLFVAMYDGRTDTSFLLAKDQSITYTFDRFVSVADFKTRISAAGGNTYVIEAPNQNGVWNTVATVQNNAQTQYDVDYATSKIFRLRNTLGGSNRFYNAPLDGGVYYTPTITTPTVGRIVDETGIQGASPAGFALQLAATDNYPAAGRLTWSLNEPLPEGFGLSGDGLITVAAGTAFPVGNVYVNAKVTDSRGFAADAVFPFRPDAVRAQSVAPVSVVGPSQQDLRVGLYDGSTGFVVTLNQDQAVTYTYDRYVTVADFEATVSSSRSWSGTPHFQLQVPSQSGGWKSAATAGFNQAGNYVNAYDPLSATAKTFRLVAIRAITLNEFRLDGAPSYGLRVATNQIQRTVGESGIVGANPAGNTLRLETTTDNPVSKSVRWSLTKVMPTGFTLSEDGLITVPDGPDFPFGYVNMAVRATDDIGFQTTGSFPFMAQAVRASSVPPVSVVGPGGQDLRTVLYDGSSSTSFVLQPGQSVAYTYDRFVEVNDASTATAYVAASSLSGYQTSIEIEVPNQDGTWDRVGTMAVGPNSTYGNQLLWGARSSRIFRVRNSGGIAATLSEFRLDAPASYGAAISTGAPVRTVDATTIVGQSPAGLTLQLASTSGHPQAAGSTWTLAGVVPTGFTLSETGLITVPPGPDFPFGYVTMPVRVTDTLGFAATATFPFRPAPVRAGTVMPVSVTGPNGEDLLAKLYDGDAATSYTLQANASIVWTYDRHVNVADIGLAAGAYLASMSPNGQIWLEVPQQNGSWAHTHIFSVGNGGVTGTAISNSTLNQSKVFRLRNVQGVPASLQEFRLDNPAAYGLTWTQSAGPFYVAEDRIAASNGGAAAPSTSGLALSLTATSGHPGGKPVVYGWKPGFTPPAGFELSADGVLAVPASSAFPAGTVDLQIRAADGFGFHAVDRTFSFVPASVRAQLVGPSSVVGPSGESVHVGLYDDDASTSTTTVLALAPGQSVTWTYPQWTQLGAASAVVANSASTTLMVERQLLDGSWQATETRTMAGGGNSAFVRNGGSFPSRVWRLRNTGQAAVSLIEWRLDGAPAYAPAVTTTLATRYVTPTTIVDALGGTAASSGSDGLALILAGTVKSPGGGALTWSWGPDFAPPEGFALSADGRLTVPARDAFPVGFVQLPFKATDPRGFSVTRVIAFAPDAARASTVLKPGDVAVLGPNNVNAFGVLVDGDAVASSPSIVLQPGESISWSFPRYVAVQAAASARNISSTTWQLESPNALGSWTLVENNSGLAGGAEARIARTYRLRNLGTSAITVYEYNIDGAARGSAPGAGSYGILGDGSSMLTPDYAGAAYSQQIGAVANDPYAGPLTYSVTGSLPAGVQLSSSGLLTVGVGTSLPAALNKLDVVLTNALGRRSSVAYTLLDATNRGVIERFGATRYYRDGTYARTCAGYKNPAAGYVYAGATGDGTYRIDPDGPTGPAQPTDVVCGEMSAGGTTTIPAFDGIYHGFPGNSMDSYKVRVLGPWQDFYLALAAASYSQSVLFMGGSEDCCDVYSWYNYGGTQLGSQYGGLGGAWRTIILNYNRENAFWRSRYYTNASNNGGHGLYVDSMVVFR